MNTKYLLVALIMFCVGAFVSIAIRGSSADADAPEVTHTEVTPAAEQETPPGVDPHAGHVADPHAGHDADPHAGHDADPHAGHDMPTAEAKPAEAALTEVYVCAQDSTIGLSYAGKCPLDGAPMVKKNIDLSSFEDVQNETCPVMGGAASEKTFALYKGKRVRFCCPGCDTTFFADPEANLKKLGVSL